MAQYIYAHGRTISGTRRIHAVSQPFFVGKISLMFMLMILIGIMGVVYMVNFNENATVGYQLTRLEGERDKIMNLREQNNIDLSTSQSLDYIKDSSVVSRMVPATQISYYDTASTVASKY